jgi:hypothetical protein
MTLVNNRADVPVTIDESLCGAEAVSELLADPDPLVRGHTWRIR